MSYISRYSLSTINRNKIFYCAVFLIISGYEQKCRGMDDSHFYRARAWPGENRSNKDKLWSIEAIFMGASTKESRDTHGHKVPLLAIYGPEDLGLLNINTPSSGKELNISYTGNFNLFETQLQGYFNFTHGFFAHIHLPVRSLQLCDIGPRNTGEKCDTTTWDSLAKQLDRTLTDHHVSTAAIKKTGVGDLSLLMGWTWTTYDSRAVDFCDATLQTGVLFPTGNKKDPYALFDIPLGYDHFGFPLIGDISIGLLGWLTLGAHLESRFFLNGDEYIRPPSKHNQQGMVRLTPPQKVRVHSGPLWDMGVYIKADHCMQGFSFVLGYSHDQKQKSFVEHVVACDNTQTHTSVDAYRNDPFLRSWNMNTLHALVEYDWSNEDNLYGPRIGLEYDYLISGENVFNASPVTGRFGLDCEWCF